MKKVFLIVVLSLLVGCSLGNTPTSKTEELLSNYQMNKNNIPVSYTYLTNDTNISSDIIKKYEDAIRKQYRDMSYEIKDEEVDGDTAVVTIEIEVMDFGKAINKYNKSEYESVRYHELITKELENTKEMITYTLDITLTKDEKDKWVVDDLSLENRDKLLGIY